MKTPAIIFDFDGTIADTLNHVFAIGNTLAEEYQFKRVKSHQIEAFRNKTMRQAIRELEVPVFKIPGLLLKGKKEQNNQIHRVQAIKGIKEVLFHLKKQNIHLGLVSTNTLENIHAFLQNQNINGIFNFISTSSGLFGKARALRKVIKQNELQAESILYIGDEIRDIEASRKVGIAIASVTWGYNSARILKQYNPDYLIHHPREIVQIAESFR